MEYRDARLKRALAITAMLIAVVAACVPIACSKPAVTWSEIAYPSRAPLERPNPAVATEPAGACPGSFRASVARGVLYGAWWHVRPDSSAALMAGRSTDGGRSWSTVTAADTLDRARLGCDRPAPSIFADSATGYVDFAYFMEPSEGPGIFYTHSMDPVHLGAGEGVFHSPVPIVYGEHPSRVSVTARGDNVAVAYEDPNALQPLVGVALSRTMGHIFENRSDVSSSDLPAVDPSVALRGNTVVVQWAERPDSVVTGGRVAVRRGEWR